MTGERLGDFIRDSRIIDELGRPKNRLIMVMGGSDTGKTTLVERLADFLAGHSTVGIVDVDMGQSHIGPPTTIAWGKCKGEFKGWSHVTMEDFYFAGAVTPFGSLLPTIVGAKLMTEEASSSCSKVVIDTSGLIAEPAGRVLKQFKTDILSPDVILALEERNELGHILDCFRFQKHPKIFRLPVPVGVVSKSVVRRSRYRFEMMLSYLKGSRVLDVSLGDIGVRFTGETLRSGVGTLKNRVVSFRDDHNRDIALGVVEKVVIKESALLIRTPMKEGTTFSTLVVGRTEIDRESSEVRDRVLRRSKSSQSHHP